jgi:hypothetical protein
MLEKTSAAPVVQEGIAQRVLADALDHKPLGFGGTWATGRDGPKARERRVDPVDGSCCPLQSASSGCSSMSRAVVAAAVFAVLESRCPDHKLVQRMVDEIRGGMVPVRRPT